MIRYKKFDGYYIIVLVSLLSELERLADDPKISLEEVQDLVYQRVLNTRATPERARFITYLFDKCADKHKIASFCTKVVEKSNKIIWLKNI